MLHYHHFSQIDSTNAFLQRKQSGCDIRNWVVSADEQTAGKGMGSNSWESEVGKNLTFSLAVDMGFLPAERQFLLSEAVPLGIVEVLDKLLPTEKLCIKWPNDIYYGNRKLAGILINSTIKANMMDISIIGIGLNVNQMHFQDWPTHPISMKMITGEDYDLQLLLEQIAEHIIIKVEQLKSDPNSIEQAYLKRLFRYRTWADYEVGGKVLRLFMTGIDPFGRLQLVDEQQTFYTFDIKEIKFVL
jgi:BirA family biotin operon repressor/biotin-[acetyl-CoA-carboxylase] ligase